MNPPVDTTATTNPTAPNPIITAVKSLRVRADALFQDISALVVAGIMPSDLIPTGDSQELSQLRIRAHEAAINKTIELKMWLGKILEGMGTPFPPALADKAAGEGGAAPVTPAVPPSSTPA